VNVLFVVRQERALDRALVIRELMPLLELKEDSTPASTLHQLFAKHQ